MTWRAVVDSLPSVSLEELNETAELLTRVDRKYVVSLEVLSAVLTGHEGGLKALEIDGRRTGNYRSVYYDTPELTSYLAAARKRPRRFKVRTREYVDSGIAAVEVKLRSARGDTVKHREWLDPGRDRGAERGSVVAYASTFAGVKDVANLLRPTLTTTYKRATLLGPSGRITIDAEVGAEDARGAACTYGDLLIVETKSSTGAGAFDRDLWARGVRPARLSKYATSLAALYPELPANRWHRTLTRYAPSHVGAEARPA